MRARGPKAAASEDVRTALQAAATLSDAEPWADDAAATDGADSDGVADGHDMPSLPGLPSRSQSLATAPSSRAGRASEAVPQAAKRVSFAAEAVDSDGEDDSEASPLALATSAAVDAPVAMLVHPKKRGRSRATEEASAASQANGEAGSYGKAPAGSPQKRKRKRAAGTDSSSVAARAQDADEGSPQPDQAPKRKQGRPAKAKPAQAEEVSTGYLESAAEAPKRKRGRPPKAKPVDLMTDIPTEGGLSEPAEAAKRKRGRPPKAKPAQLSTQLDVVKRKRGRPPKHKPGAPNGEQSTEDSAAAAYEDPHESAAQAAAKQRADLDTAALLRASQLQMAAIEAALAEDSDL